MKQYTKINTIFERNEENQYKIVESRFADPVFEDLKDIQWWFTEKIHGINIRVQWFADIQRIRFAGKTDDSQLPIYLVDKLEDYFKTTNALELFKSNFASDSCIYGEGFGPKLQRGGEQYGSEVDFAVFDVKIQQWWLERKDRLDVADTFKVPSVPLIGSGTLMEAVEMCREGFNSRYGDFEAEGIVCTPCAPIQHRDGSRIIAKIKCKDFEKRG